MAATVVESQSSSKMASNPPKMTELEVASESKGGKESIVNEDVQKEVASVAAASADKVEEEENVILTYKGSKDSMAYGKAKAQLSAGEFEVAMEEIETELTKRMSVLGNEFHECLAPLYYLYGTTLLYSVEESTDTSVMQQQQQQQQTEEEAGDLQIAWENLELSRSILSSMANRTNEQELDLAQVHMRLGDLQRANGNYAEAMEDYQHAHTLRKQSLETYYDRRIADTLYSLGMCSLLLAAESEKQTSAPSTDPNPKVSLSPQQILEYREKSILHYLECARVLVGIIALLCDKDAEKEAHVEAVKLDPHTLEPTIEYASQSLKTLRARTQIMAPSDNLQAMDLQEMLDEIQEVIDNTQQDQQGLQTVGAMKAMAEQQAEEDHNDKKPPAKTTIGFGTSNISTTTPTTTNLMVKKKKKREDSKPEATKKPRKE